MAEVVNLNARRKTAARKAARTTADANAAKFGRTRAERDAETAHANKSTRELDNHKRES